jgi:hypothetical protein
MTADELHAAVDEMDTDNLREVVCITFHAPDRVCVGSSLEDPEVVILAIEQALAAAKRVRRGALN